MYSISDLDEDLGGKIFRYSRRHEWHLIRMRWAGALEGTIMGDHQDVKEENCLNTSTISR